MIKIKTQRGFFDCNRVGVALSKIVICAQKKFAWPKNDWKILGMNKEQSTHKCFVKIDNSIFQKSKAGV